MLTVIAGTGVPGDSEADGPAKICKLSGPAGLVLDPFGAIFVADSGNRRVRKIANGSMETITDANKNKLDFGAVTSIALDRTRRIHAAGGSRIPVVAQMGLFRISRLPPTRSSSTLRAAS